MSHFFNVCLIAPKAAAE